MLNMSRYCHLRERMAQILLLGTLAFLPGCAQQGYYVLAATGTVIGVEVSQNPATQTPQAKLGYNRGELAFVPTNRSGGDSPAMSIQQGAKDTANVIMEIRYGGIFDTGPGSGIYQRLAVGDKAVEQPGAAFMFLKDASGNLSPSALDRAEQALSVIPGPSGKDGQSPKSKDNARETVGKIP